MRLILQQRQLRSLSVNFEPVPGQVAEVCQIAAQRRRPDSADFGVPILSGTGCPAAIWNEDSGRLLWAPERASDFGWSPDGQVVYVLRGGFGFTLTAHRWPDREPLEELPVRGVDLLSVSPLGGLAAVVQIQGPEWYYEVVRLQPKLESLGVRKRIDDYFLDGPIFSPDERYLVTVGSPRYRWWGEPDEEADEDEWQFPSEGGPYEIGWIHVHDLASHRVVRHPLVVHLPAGWTPQPRLDDPGDWPWTVLWGPEFTSPSRFRIWLPGGVPVDLDLPLPPTIEIPATIPMTWEAESVNELG